MTTDLLPVIEQLVGALEALHYDIGTINQQHGLSEAALAASKQALEQPQGEADPDDSLLICASDLEHSAIYDNHSEMQSCIRAVAQRIKSLATNPQATEPQALEQTQGDLSADDLLGAAKASGISWHVHRDILADFARRVRATHPQATEPAFNPDWSLLEATQESLREHMAMVKATEPIAEYCEHGTRWDTVCRSCDELPATEPAPSCTRCGATTGQACNDMGCGFLEAGNGEPAPIGFNGLTQAETEATMSVRGLSEPAPRNQQDNRFYREKSTEQTPSTELPGMWDTSDFTGGATDMPAPSTAGEQIDADDWCVREDILNIARATGAEEVIGNWLFYMTGSHLERFAAALLSAPALPVGELTDSDIRKIWSDICAEWADKGGNPYLKYARAILAAASTQPVREPLTEEQRKELWHGTIEAHSKWTAYAWFSYGIRQAEAAHGITKKGQQ